MTERDRSAKGGGRAVLTAALFGASRTRFCTTMIEAGFMGMDRQQGQNNSIGAIRRAQKHGLQRAMKREREKEIEIEKIK